MGVSLKERVAIVTGAGGGLGRAHALELARLGAKVVVNDPGRGVDGSGDDRSAAQKVVDEIVSAGGVAVANHDSVSEFASAQRIVAVALEKFGRIDALVNNAGILRDKSFVKMDMADFEKVVAVHFMGTVYCTKAAWGPMTEQKFGRIVVTTSSAGIAGGFGQANYGAAKMAVLGFMNCLALEGAKNNILINAISPAATTRMTEALVSPELGKYMRPDLISPAVAWLCSESCKESGLIVSAIAGYFARVHAFETQGVQFDPTSPVTPDMVCEAFADFGRLDRAVAAQPGPLGDLEGRLKTLGLL
jgi:NAD(P)-dependent dehydrogenase (short-subunit alcohol dehydrogenase family)